MVAYPVKFGGHKHSCNGDIFLVVEEENHRCHHFKPPILFVSTGHILRANHISN